MSQPALTGFGIERIIAQLKVNRFLIGVSLEGKMAQPLFCDFLIPSEKGPKYWWPIIFEAMGRKCFFYCPRKARRPGILLLCDLQNYSDTDSLSPPFALPGTECSKAQAESGSLSGLLQMKKSYSHLRYHSMKSPQVN